MSQWQLNFNCQISFTHHAAKQHNAIARGSVAGALLVFFCQGIAKKKSSLPVVPFNHNILQPVRTSYAPINVIPGGGGSGRAGGGGDFDKAFMLEGVAFDFMD